MSAAPALRPLCPGGNPRPGRPPRHRRPGPPQRFL